MRESENALRQPTPTNARSTCGVDIRRLITRTGRVRRIGRLGSLSFYNPGRLLIPHDRLQRVCARHTEGHL